MKNDEHAFRFAGEVDNFRVADNPLGIQPGQQSAGGRNNLTTSRRLRCSVTLGTMAGYDLIAGIPWPWPRDHDEGVIKVTDNGKPPPHH